MKEYWIVDPVNRIVHVHSLHKGIFPNRVTYGEEDDLQSKVFADLIIPLRAVFEF